MFIGSWLFQAMLAGVIGTATSVLPVQVETISGEKFTGNWQGNTASVIRMSDGEDSREIAFDQLVSVSPKQEPKSGFPPANLVSLKNGTQLRAQDLTMKGADLMIEPRRQPAISIPVNQIRAVRFRLGTPETDLQWFGLIDKENRSDVMVISRSGQQLDPIEGAVLALNLNELQFEIEDEKIDAPVDRLEGVLFRSVGQDASSRANVLVKDIYGSEWSVDGLEPSNQGETLRIRLSGGADLEGIIHEIPMDQVKSIFWASGRVLLASQSAAESDVRPLLKSELPSELFSNWFRPRGDGEDLVAVAGTSVEYRIDPGFQTFAGSVRRDPDAEPAGEVKIRISIDEDVKWEQSLRGDQSLGYRVPLGEGRRVKLEVLPGDDGDLGDQVEFIQPRLQK